MRRTSAGAVLALDGCCYVADLARLERRLSGFTAGVLGPAARGAGGAAVSGTGGGGGRADGGSGIDGGSSSHPLPVLISFADGTPALAGPAAAQALARQLLPLLAAVERHAAAPAGVAGGRGAPWPVIDMGTLQGLPLMPTLNGWLLGYPVVYHVASREDAATAGRVLSCAPLVRGVLRAECAALEWLAHGGGSGSGRGSVGTRPSCASDGGAGRGPGDELLAFTAPLGLADEAVRAGLTAAARAAERAAAAAGAGVWRSRVAEATEVVGTGVVSL